MAVFKIVTIGEEGLRKKAKEVPEITPNIHKLLDNLADTLYDAQGVGLAAPQIGVPKRVAVIDVGEGLIELINPVVLKADGELFGPEGCLSVPGVTGEVTRFSSVTVQALDREGNAKTYEAEGLLARALQHELDHLDGVLFVDKADKLEKAKA